MINTVPILPHSYHVIFYKPEKLSTLKAGFQLESFLLFVVVSSLQHG